MKMTRPLPLLFWTACVTLLLALAPASVLGADSKPPEKMAFQGFLTDQNGVARGQSAPVNLVVTFRLYKTATAAANQAVWSEQQTVTVDKGHFSVVLGDGVLQSGSATFSTHFSGNDTDAGRYLGVTVSGEAEISPRIQFFTAPYASLARYATELVGTGGSSVLKVTGNQAGINLVGAPTTTLDVGGIVTATGLDVNGTSTLDGTTTVAGSLRVTGNNVLELGSGVAGKEGSAGKIGYGTFTTGVLDIVGAGTAGNNRAVKIWAEAGTTFTGPITATTLNGDGSALTGVAKLGANNTFTGYQEVQNHLRIGELASSGASAGWGEALIFSGAPPLQGGNSDNTDPLWLARYNTAANSSELRMVIGDDPGSSADAFVIGTMVGGNFNQANTWTPMFGFTARGLLDFGYGKTKEVSAGTIGYQVHSADSLDIVGAGTTGSNRRVQIWSEGGLVVNGPMTGLRVSTPTYGLTAQVTDYYLRIFHPSDKNKMLDIDRVNNGVRIWAAGGGFGNATGDTRQIVWDGDGNWDVSSDRKLKKNIEDAESVLDRALKVQLRRYNWKEEPNGAKKSMGVIAQELLPLFPDMVGHTEEKTTGESHLTVGYADFGMIAIKAIQEFKAKHDAEVKELKAQHNAEMKDLKAQVVDLNAQMKQVLQAAAELRGQLDKNKTTASVTK